MDESDGLSVLKRMTAAGLEAAPASRQVLPLRALSSAVSRAAEAGLSMAVVATASSERVGSLSDLLETLPDNGLLGVLDGPGDEQGLMAFDAPLLSAVIEKQMTGALASKAPPVRRATRTDAALAADLVDSTLREFEASLLGREEARWAAGFGYSSHVEDIRPLGLLLEDVDFRIFGLDLDLEGGTRSGRLVLAVPAEGRGEIGTPSNGANLAEARDESWDRGFGEAVLGAQVQVNAAIHRLRIPFANMKELKVGDELTLPGSSVDTVRLTSSEGTTYGTGRLGQSRGHRAVRIAALGDTRPAPSSIGGAALADGITGQQDNSFAPSIMASDISPPVHQVQGLQPLPEMPPSEPLPELPDISAEFPMAQAPLDEPFPAASMPPVADT